MLTTYVSLPTRPEFSRNMTGFGYMVYDISNSVGQKANVDLLASDSVGDAFQDNNVHFIRRKYIDIVLNIFRCVSPRILFSLLRKYKLRKGTALRLLYYWLISGYYSKVIKKGGYDIVHMHSCNLCNEFWIKVCERHKKKYLITLHALNSFSETVKLEPGGKQYERDFFMRVNEGKVNVSVISTGMKRMIESLNGSNKCDNINVVCNSFKDYAKMGFPKAANVRKLYGIPDNAYIILYAGNISENKNQKQLVDAFDLIDDTLRDNIYVLFCGKYNNDYPFEKMVHSSKYSNHFILCGQIDREEMPAYFEAANSVVLLSVSEGFGLSLIEGMSYGKPCLTFTDIDAFDDIYNSCAMIGVKSRNNEDLSNGIGKLINTNWDSNSIIEYSKRFNSSHMADNYIEVYKNL